MALGGRFIAWIVICVVLLSVCLMFREIEVVRYPAVPSRARDKVSRISAAREGYGPDVEIKPYAILPNEGRRGVAAPSMGNDVGTRSEHNGVLQRERQLWLNKRAEWLRDENGDGHGDGEVEQEAGEGGHASPIDENADGVKSGGGKSEREDEGGEETGEHFGVVSMDERLHRLERGEELWGATYIPPIVPERKQELIAKWSAPNDEEEKDHCGGTPRILLVVTSFDRGRRLGTGYRELDKLDYMLMIADEMREACEAGFSPQLHLIAAWDPAPETMVFQDRLFCERTGRYVPFSFETHDPSINEALSIKHRVYMKPRVDQFDVFIQVEDDMIFSLNHILLFVEESENLALRRRGDDGTSVSPIFDLIPGFMRVEPARPASKKTGQVEASGVGGEWFEWEIILSRFRGARVEGAGTYLTLDSSKALPYHFGANNQGLWIATKGQLNHLRNKCGYLRYNEKSKEPFVEKYSGSLEMYSDPCGVTKVFPAARFEDFLVHHRTNNKNGLRGESIPAVPISMLRLWASQVVRDSGMLREIDERSSRKR